MIRVESLEKYYGDFQALKGIDFQIHDGEIVGFLGANGAGKSTTLKIMTGFLAPTSGNVFLDEQNIHEHSLEIRRQIGYLPELNPLYGEMKVYDYLEFTSQIREMERDDFLKSLGRVVEQCGLTSVIHKQISECSKGYKQRVGLAAAILHDPKVLILDEPVSGLDPNQIVEIRNLIKELGREKMVIMSSHILQEIAVTVDRIVIINQGQIVADGTSNELMASLQGQTQLNLEVKYATDENVSAVPGLIPGVELLNSQNKDGVHEVVLAYERGTDPREQIFNYAKQNNWVVLEMSQTRVQLEDVFRTLTAEGGVHA